MAIPDNVYQALNEAKAAWDSLYVTVPQNKAKWTPEQLKALGIHAEIAKQTYSAIYRLVQFLDK